MPDLHLTLLGPVRMWRDGTQVPLGSPQQRAVLAVLILHEGRVVPNEELVEALWGEAAPRGAWGTLRTYVSRLRQVLTGSGVLIETAGTGYAARTPSGSVDATTFRTLVARARDLSAAGDPGAATTSLAEALALWSGEALDGVPGAYATRQRTRLQAARLDAAELRFTLMLDAGTDAAGHEDVVPELTHLVEQHPFREQLRGLLMRALYRQGRQADALAAYQAGGALLRDELGIDPGPALRAVHQRILVSDPALLTVPGFVPVPVPESLHVPGPVPALPARLSTFTGREAELARIADALTEPTDGTTTTVGIYGLDGLGRSALAIEAAHRAAGQFPGGRLYADLEHLPRELTETLGAWLGAYGVPHSDVPGSATARAIRLQAAAGGRRVLAVLDGVEDTTTLSLVTRALPPGSAVLFVARRRHAEPVDATWVHAGPLPAPDAWQLLAHVAGHDRIAADPAATTRLIELLCGWPLPLRLIGRRLNLYPHWSVATVADQLVRELANPAEILHDDCLLAEAPVLRAYTRLRPAQARALRRTSQLDGETFTIHQAAEVMGTTSQDAWSVLDSLVELGLLTGDSPAGLPISTTYQMATVTRSFAHRQADGADGADGADVRLARA